ncbi:MAG TPA: hypothetical protein VF941_12585, partial [Clostridia bacterium]
CKHNITKTLLLLTLLFGLSGCSAQGKVDGLIKAPRLSDAQAQIQMLLNKHLSANAVLVCPSKGEFQKSIEYIDLNQDQQDEAIAFFREKGSDFYNNKIGCLILSEDKQNHWFFKEQLIMDGTSFERVMFRDLNGDGYREILFFTETEGTTLRNILVFDGSKGGYELQLNEFGADFIVEDLDMDGICDIIRFHPKGYDLQYDCSLFQFQQGKWRVADEKMLQMQEKFSFVLNPPEKSGDKRWQILIKDCQSKLEVIHSELIFVGTD